MNVYNLSFGPVNIINPNLLEVIVNHGVVFGELEVDEFHDFLLTNLEAPFCLLVNKKYDYSYTFEAQKSVGNLKEVKAIAFLSATLSGAMIYKTMSKINGKEAETVKMFNDRAKALSWLAQQ
jgi:hypothetical protein